jgi:hypothetical protein
MNKLKQLLLLLICFVFINNSHAQKKVLAVYDGGHGCLYETLTLYTDSTYVFEHTSALMFVITKRNRGHYLITDNSITLFKRKRKHPSNVYRIQDNKILTFTLAQEQSKDSNMVRDYGTLYGPKIHQ